MSEENQTLELEVIQESKSQIVASSDSRQLVASAPADLFMLAISKGATLEQIEKVMELQERYEANQAKKAYVAAMADFKRNAPTIYKSAVVEHSGIKYNHAKLGDICELVIPVLAEYGFSHRWDQVQPGNGLIQVTCILTHKLGHSESTMLEAPADNSGKKNTIQQISSTVTYLQRYSFLGACGLSTKDLPDDDGQGYGDPEPQKEPEIVKKTLSGKSFEKAIASVKAGTYSAADINKYYTLTTDQQIILDDEIKNFKGAK